MTEEELAERLVERMSLDECVQYCIKSMVEFYKANPETFKSELADELDV